MLSKDDLESHSLSLFIAYLLLQPDDAKALLEV